MLTPDKRDPNYKSESKRRHTEPESFGPDEAARLKRLGRRPGDRRERSG